MTTNMYIKGVKTLTSYSQIPHIPSGQPIHFEKNSSSTSPCPPLSSLRGPGSLASAQERAYTASGQPTGTGAAVRSGIQGFQARRQTEIDLCHNDGKQLSSGVSGQYLAVNTALSVLHVSTATGTLPLCLLLRMDDYNPNIKLPHIHKPRSHLRTYILFLHNVFLSNEAFVCRKRKTMNKLHQGSVINGAH